MCEEIVKDSNQDVKVDVKIDNKDLIDELKKINNNIADLKESTEKIEHDNSININNGEGSTELVDSQNKKLNDYELCKRCIHQIDEDTKSGKPVNIPPNFVDFMRQLVSHVDNGGTIQEFKNQEIYKQIDWSKVKL